jgi:4-amino-4-deoxychorismate lyase
LDERGYVVETLRCNLLLWRDGQWFTPDLSHSGVRGVMRSWLAQRVDLQCTDLTLADLIAAGSQPTQELALCNSVRGVIPVSELFENTGVSVTESPGENGRTSGPQTRHLQQLIAEKLW